jgi:hypothetical protein
LIAVRPNDIFEVGKFPTSTLTEEGAAMPLTLTLQDALRRKLSLVGERELSMQIRSCEESAFRHILETLFLGLPPEQVSLLRSHYGIGKERMSLTEVRCAYFPELKNVSVNERITTAFGRLLHPLRKEVMRKGLAGEPYPKEGPDRPVVTHIFTPHALNYLWRGQVITFAELKRKSNDGVTFWPVQGFGEKVYEEIRDAMAH